MTIEGHGIDNRTGVQPVLFIGEEWAGKAYENGDYVTFEWYMTYHDDDGKLQRTGTMILDFDDWSDLDDMIQNNWDFQPPSGETVYDAEEVDDNLIARCDLDGLFVMDYGLLFVMLAQGEVGIRLIDNEQHLSYNELSKYFPVRIQLNG